MSHNTIIVGIHYGRSLLFVSMHLINFYFCVTTQKKKTEVDFFIQNSGLAAHIMFKLNCGVSKTKFKLIKTNSKCPVKNIKVHVKITALFILNMAGAG